ncbi:MAG: radical SAM protein, partial [Desulfobacterota bacterium]|nr:radical SAM protein [Thermodesulfobacteriota bacterium]
MIKEGSINQLRQFIKLKEVPFSVVFEITNQCDLQCVHCYQENKKKKELTLNEIKLILDDLANIGTMKLTLTGGEPFLREDFVEIYQYCIQKRFATTLFTNATLISPEHKKILLKNPPWAVECSLYGATANTHELITGVNGVFEGTLSNIKWMVSKGIRVIIKSIILSLNFNDLNALAQLCDKLGITFYPSFRVYPSADPNRSVKKLRIATADFKKLLKKNNWLLKRYRGELYSGNQSNGFICNAGREACC